MFPSYYESKSVVQITQIEIDTLDGSPFNIIFFRPSEKEYDKLWEIHGEESGLNEVDSDHGFYASKVIDSFSQTEVHVVVAKERVIQLPSSNGPIYFDRLENGKGVYGLILYKKGCDPRIEHGVMTDVGIFQEYSDYRKNCR